jgi:hypothetical protein
LPGGALGLGTMKVSLASGTVELPAAVGSFDWLLPVGGPDDTAHLAVHFSAGARLPGGDDRPVGGKLEWMEVFRSLPTYTFEFGKPTATRLACMGIDQDGWFSRSATIQLPPFDREHDVVLTFEYPGWADTKEMSIRAESPGSAKATQLTLQAGAPRTMRLRLSASATPRTLRIEAPGDFPLAAPDTRRRAGRLVQMEVQPIQRS